MENNDKVQEQQVENQKGMELTDMACQFLKEVAKWAKFLSILGFIGIGFMLIFAFFFGAIMANVSSELSASVGTLQSGLLTFFYLIVAVITFFPIYYQYKFASKAGKALEENDTFLLTESLRYLKSHYKFLGILYLVTVLIYAFAIIFMIVMGVAATVLGSL